VLREIFAGFVPIGCAGTYIDLGPFNPARDACFWFKMEAASLSTLAKPFVAIGKALAPVVRQLHAERQAGAASATVKTALLDAPLRRNAQPPAKHCGE
jgi:hypothetical protein